MLSIFKLCSKEFKEFFVLAFLLSIKNIQIFNFKCQTEEVSLYE